MGRLLALSIPIAAVMMAINFNGGSKAGETHPLPRFKDVFGSSQVHFQTRNGYQGRKYFPQPMCGGVAIVDYDGDGWPDIFFTNGAALPQNRKVDSSYFNRLLHNRHDGTFEDVTDKAGLNGSQLGYSFGVAAGDYDNDGFPDLFVAGMGRNTLYHNNGNGSFTDVTELSGLGNKPEDLLSVSAAWFDYDNDGKLDLIVSNYTRWTPETDVRCRKDDNIDIYCDPRTYKSVANRLYHNLGQGRFEDVTETSGFSKALGKGMGIGIADFNHDGLMDVFVANDTERNFLYLNGGGGRFEEVGLLYGVAYNEEGTVVSGMGADAKDFDNDGWVDVIFNDLRGQVFGLFRNSGGKGFEYASTTRGVERISRPFSGWSMAFADIDNDGWKDIYSANGDVDNLGADAVQHDSIFLNEGGKLFRDVSSELGRDLLRTGYQRGAAIGDLNNDGALDVVVTSLNAEPRILLNSGTVGNHWLIVDARGRLSNRDAIGAQLKVVTGSGRTLFNHVTTAQGFLSSADRRVHFGLGPERVVQSLEITWPSGAVRKIRQVGVDQILKVVE